MHTIDYLGHLGSVLSPNDLDRMIAESSDNPQFVAVLRGVKHLGIVLQCVLPDAHPQPIVEPPARSVVLIDDGDLTRAMFGLTCGGPGGFHAGSLDDIIRDAGLVIVNGTDPVTATGVMAILAADQLGLALLIDTDGGQFPAWAEHVEKVRGSAGVVLAGDPMTLPASLRSKTMNFGKIA